MKFLHLSITDRLLLSRVSRYRLEFSDNTALIGNERYRVFNYTNHHLVDPFDQPCKMMIPSNRSISTVNQSLVTIEKYNIVEEIIITTSMNYEIARIHCKRAVDRLFKGEMRTFTDSVYPVYFVKIDRPLIFTMTSSTVKIGCNGVVRDYRIDDEEIRDVLEMIG